MMGIKKLRVLLVETSPDDAAHTLAKLKESGYAVVQLRVDNASDMRAALAGNDRGEEGWDAVLCSYDPDGFCGLEALNLVQSLEIDIPFVFLSHDLREETIIHTMQAGADDYIFKGSLNRLAPSIEHNLRAARIRREHRTAQLALLENQTRLHAFIADLPGMAYQVLLGPDGGMSFPYVSEGSHAVLGLSPQDLEKCPALFLDMLHPDDRASYAQTMDTSARQLSFWNWEGRIRILPDNETKWINLRCSPRTVQPGILWEGIMFNITQSKLAEIEVNRSQEQLRELSSHIHDVREQERLAIAREVHDDLGSTLTAIKLDIAWLGGRLKSVNPKLAAKARNIENLVDKCTVAATNISRTLRPSVLDAFGIVAAVEMEANEFEQRTGIACTLKHSDEGAAPAPDVAIALFRIFQESLTNITKHSRASKVAVEVTNRAECINLTVSDNGCGCTEADRSKPHSFGLRGIRERVAHFGGDVRIFSAPGKGTTIAVCIPHQRRSEPDGGVQAPVCATLEDACSGAER
ncbi:MAG: PAS domain-containing protein [Nitrosomonadales bacterium]|nr:PAS domain-containing protein [Nitrosomonadales bacterium]